MDIQTIGNIYILSHEKIKERITEFYNINKNKDNEFENEDLKSSYLKGLEQPLPYALFRLNEILSYKLNGFGCEITEEQYYERLEQLPPKPFKNDILKGYIVPEMITFGEKGNIYEHIFKYNNKYYCVIMETGFKVV